MNNIEQAKLSLHSLAAELETHFDDNSHVWAYVEDLADVINTITPYMLSAPELLSALKACLPDLEHYAATHGPGPDRRLADALQAIAKAEGAEE